MQLSHHRNVCVRAGMVILHLQTGSLHKLDLEFQYKSIKQSICIRCYLPCMFCLLSIRLKLKYHTVALTVMHKT